LRLDGAVLIIDNSIIMENISPHSDSDRALASRLKALRQSQGLSLDALAQVSGVSRAMISKIERGEASPTASLLGRLCAGLGTDLGWLFQPEAETPREVARRDEQPVWRDPETGYLRRALTPAGARSPVRMIEVELPPGARVAFESAFDVRRVDQHVFMLEGEIVRTVGARSWRLGPGDCWRATLDEPSAFHNPGETPARYLVVLAFAEPA
jgi:transcriptional regulator with XRE-family HTH domain